jgi:hypothetical protein
MKYEIPLYKKALFESKLGVLNNRAAKIGVAPIEYSYGLTFLKEADTKDGKIKVEAVEVEVKGFTPTYDGWSVVSRFRHEDGITTINSVNGLLPPEEYRNITDPVCEHCGTHKVKKRSVLLYNRNEGYKVVGRTCMKNFVDSDLENQLNFYERFADFANEIEENYGFSNKDAGLSDYRFDLKEVVAMSVALTEKSGYVSAGKASEEKLVPTKSIVSDMLLNRVTKIVPSADDYKVADEVIAWVRNKPVNNYGNEFIYNLKNICSKDSTVLRYLGYIVAAYPSYKRELEKKAKEPVYADEYAGEIKERKEFEVELLKKHVIDGYYGTTTIHTFVDSENHLLVWFASASLGVENEDGIWVYAKVGDKFKLTGTVKKHDTYNGNKQTVINRCKVSGDKENILDRYKKECEDPEENKDTIFEE